MKTTLPGIFSKFFTNLFLFMSLFGAVAQAGPKEKSSLPVIRSDKHPSGFKKLSSEDTTVPKRIKFAVIGSGYGGSIFTYRIAQALSAKNNPILGQVVLLERGKEMFPGDFPETPLELGKAMKTPINPDGFLNIDTDSKADMEIISASALGGTSNMNIAITLRPRDNVWEQPEWPAEIRKAFKDGALEKYFLRAEAMLKPNLGPVTMSVPKVKAHKAGLPAGFPTVELTLNVNHIPGREQFGVTQNACTYCGNCAAGCNVGAKNTLTTNYLPAAKQLNETAAYDVVKIITRTDINYIEQLPSLVGANGEEIEQWQVHYTQHYQKNKMEEMAGIFHKEEGSFVTDHVILAGGATGTTAILMRSQEKGLDISPALGTKVSANGDVMGFMYNSNRFINIAAYEDTKSLTTDAIPVGQTISFAGNFHKANENSPIEEQFVLLDGAVPAALAPTIAKILPALSVAGGEGYQKEKGFFGIVNSVFGSDAMRRAARVTDDMLSLYPGPEGALNHSQLLLACGHDSSGGRFVLKPDKSGVYAVWPNMQKEHSFQYIEQKMREYAKRLGGEFIPNPRAQKLGGGKMPVPHPLGGAPMGDSFETGVVDHLGRLRKRDGTVYKSFRIVDASIFPRSAGVPPLITSSMLGERSVEEFINSIPELAPEVVAGHSACDPALKQ